jgi:predicted ArsR family transcriptional regulator
MHKRPRLAIRVQILLLLKKIPMSTLELSKKIGCSLEEVERELLYLESQGRIEKIHSEKFNMYFWRLKTKQKDTI